MLIVQCAFGAATTSSSKKCKSCQDYFQGVCAAPAGCGEDMAITLQNECFVGLRSCQTGQSRFHKYFRFWFIRKKREWKKPYRCVNTSFMVQRSNDKEVMNFYFFYKAWVKLYDGLCKSDIERAQQSWVR